MPDTPRAWIRLPSGAALDLINPRADAWTDEDLAFRLARTYRWGGESAWPRPLSVAQHSLCVLALRRADGSGALSAAQARAELLHDAEEGFLGFDCISPLKRVLGEPFRQVSDRLMAAIARRYALPDWTTRDPPPAQAGRPPRRRRRGGALRRLVAARGTRGTWPRARGADGRSPEGRLRRNAVGAVAVGVGGAAVP